MALDQHPERSGRDSADFDFLARPIPYLVSLWRQIGQEAPPRRTVTQAPELFAALQSEIIPRLVIANQVEAPAARALPAQHRPAFTAGDREALIGALLGEDASEVWRLTEGHLADGHLLSDLLVDLFANSARTLGDLWLDDSISFVDVTIGVCRLHETVHRLTGSQETQPADELAGAPSILMASAPGEQHVFGVLVASELFRQQGWSVTLDMDGDATALARILSARHFDVLGLSVSSESLATDLPALVRTLRKASKNASIKVLAGGAAFAGSLQRARAAGADDLAGSGPDAPEHARKLLAMP
jgi:MerR family transcriptional regulator, light-induced transcriptional regulator